MKKFYIYCIFLFGFISSAFAETNINHTVNFDFINQTGKNINGLKICAYNGGGFSKSNCEDFNSSSKISQIDSNSDFYATFQLLSGNDSLVIDSSSACVKAPFSMQEISATYLERAYVKTALMGKDDTTDNLFSVIITVKNYVTADGKPGFKYTFSTCRKY